MASKSVIETNRLNIGSSGMTGLYVGNTESKYAVITDSSSGVTVIYDKVTYNFDIKDIPSTVPANGGTYTVTATTSNRVHGNGAVDSPISFSPTTITIPANTGSSRTSATTITQSYSNLTDAVNFTQEADYVTTVTLTLGTPSVIPASGGSVNSTSYSMTANYKSGRVETKTSGLSLDWTGVTAASKGTTISNQGTVGTLKASVTYGGVTATASKSVEQAGNWVESIEITGASATYTRIPASGGTSSDSGSKGTVKYTYSSNSTGTTAPSTTYGAISSSVTYSMTNGNGFTLASTSTGNVSATSKSTTPSNVTSANTLTKSITWTWTPTSGYSTKGTKSATVTPTATVTQEANYITSVAATCGAISYATFAAGGGTATAAPTNGANSYKVTYKSNSTAGTISTTYYTVNESVAYSASANNVNGFTSASTFTTDAKVTAAARGTTPGAARNGMTVTKTYGVTITPVSGKDYGNTGALESSNGKSAVPTQECNAIISVTATCGTFSYSTFAAGGGTAAPTTNGANSYKVTYKSGSTGATVDTSIYTLATDVAYSASANNVNGFTSASTFTTDAKVTAASRGTTPGAARNGMTVTKTYTVTITPASGKDYCSTGAITHNNQKTATPSQEANYITSVVATCGDFSYATFAAAGETKAPTLSADSYKVTYKSSSTAATVSSTYYTATPSVSYSASANNVNGFTSASTFTTDAKVTAASRGTVLGNERNGMTVTKTYSITITPVSGKDYGSIGAKTHSGQKTAIPQQAANYVVSVVATATTGRDSHFYYSNIAPSATTATRTGSGAGVYTFSSGKELYNASASPTFGGTASYARSNFVLSQSQNGFTAVNSSSGNLTATSLGTTISNARTSGTVTGKLVITYTHPSGINGGTVASAEYNSTATCTQNGNYVESISVANVGLSYANIGSNGGSVNPSGSDGTVTFTFTTNATTTTTPSSTYGSLTKDISYEMTDGNGFTLDSTSTGKVSATSKGTTIGNETTSNTVTKTVCYTWTPTSSYNSKGTKTTNPCGTATATVKQSGNYVTGLTIASTTISYAAIPCGGGSSTPTGDFGVITYHFSDGSTSTTAPASTYGTLTTGVTYAMTNSGRFTLDSTSTGKVSATSKGTTIENATSSNSVTKTVTATWAPTASYNASGTKTAENTASATVTQNGNYVTAITISGCALTYPNVGAGGGTSTPSGSNGSVTYAYCSNSTSTTTPSSTYGSLTSSATYTMTTGGTFTAINGTTGVVTVGTKGTTISNATSSNTVTKTVTWAWTPTASYNASGAKTGTGTSTAKVTQNGNYVSALTVTTNPAVNYGSAVHASGGTASDSGSNGAMAKYTYSSTATGSTTPASTYGTLGTGKTYSMTTSGTFTAINSSNGNITVGSKGTTYGCETTSNTVTKKVTWTWTPAASYNSAGTKSTYKEVTGTAKQAMNVITGVTATCGTFSYTDFDASGGTKTPTSNANSYTVAYSSKATANSANSTYYTTSATVSYSMTNGNGFTSATTFASDAKVTAANRGTTYGERRCSNTITKTYSVTITPKSGNPCGGTTAISNSKQQTGNACQAANDFVGISATAGTFAYDTIPAYGGNYIPSTNNPDSWEVIYSSGSKGAAPNDQIDYTEVSYFYALSSNIDGFIVYNPDDGDIEAAPRGTTPGAARTDTVEKKYTIDVQFLDGRHMSADDTKTATVTQEANYVTSVAVTCGTFSYSTFAAAGETKTPSTNNSNSYKVTYKSNSTAATVSSTYYTATPSVSYSASANNVNGFTSASTFTSDAKVTAASRGTTPGAARNGMAVTKTYTVTITPVSGKDYGSTGAVSKSATQSATPSQGANYVTSVAVTCGDFSYATFAASGETKAPNTNNSNSYKVTYKSNSTAATVSSTYYTSGASVSYSASANNVNGFTSASTFTSDAKVTAASRGTVLGNERNGMTVTKTYTVTITPVSGKDYGSTGSVSKSASQTAVPSQEANGIKSLTATAGTFAYSTFPASGDIYTPSTNNSNSYAFTYTSNATGTTAPNGYSVETSVSYTLIDANGFSLFDENSGDIEAVSRGTTPGPARTSSTITKTYEVYLYYNDSEENYASDSKTTTAVQEANYITDIRAICGTFAYGSGAVPASGGNKALSTNNANSYKVTYNSNATANTVNSTYYELTESVRFSSSGGKGSVYDDGTIEVDGRGANPGGIETISVTKEYYVTVTPKSGYNYGGKDYTDLDDDDTKTATTTQEANYITSVAVTCGTFSYSTFAASGGTKTPTSNLNSYIVTYSSSDTADTVNSAYYTATPSLSYSIGSCSGFAITASTGAVKANSRGTTEGSERCCTVTKTYGVTITPVSGKDYGNTGAKSKSAQQTTSACQAKNSSTDSWNNVTINSFAYEKVLSAGYDCTTPTVSVTQTGTRTWDSGSSSSLTNSDFTYSYSTGSSQTGMSLGNANTGQVCGSDRGTTYGDERCMTIILTVNGAGNKSKTASTTCCQEQNHYTDVWYTPSFSATYSQIPASGGTSNVSITNIEQYGMRTWDSGSEDELFNDENLSCTYSVKTPQTGMSLNTTNGSVTGQNRGTTDGNARSIVVNITGTGNGGKTYTNSVTCTQAHNNPSITWNNPTVSASYPIIPASGGTSTPTVTKSQTGVKRWPSTSTASTSYTPTISYSATTTQTGMSLNTSTGIVSGSTRGTVEGAARRCLSVRVRATGNGKTTDTTVSCCQEENLADYPRITNVSLDLDEFSIRDIPASGGTVNLVPPDSVYVNYYVEYTSGARANYSDTFYYDDFENADFDGETSYSASTLGCTLRGRTKVGTVTGILYLSKDDWYGQGEIAYSVDVYQQANQVVSTGTAERTAGSAHNYNYEISIGTSPWTNDLNGERVDAPDYGQGEYMYEFDVCCRHQRTYEQTAVTRTYTSGSICNGSWNYVEDTNNDTWVNDNFSIDYQCDDTGAVHESSCTTAGTGCTRCYLRYGAVTDFIGGQQDEAVYINVIITNEGDDSSAGFTLALPEHLCCALNEGCS